MGTLQERPDVVDGRLMPNLGRTRQRLPWVARIEADELTQARLRREAQERRAAGLLWEEAMRNRVMGRAEEG